MERVLRVRDLRDRPSGARVFLDLPDLLPHVAPEGQTWTWAIQNPPELFGPDDEAFDLPTLQADIRRGPRGLQMSFGDLVRLGDWAKQVIWGEFLAFEDPSNLPAASSSAAEVGRNAVAGLAAIDSSFWIVGGPAAVVERIASHFSDVDELAASEWDRAAD